MGDDFDFYPGSDLFDFDSNGKLSIGEKAEYLNTMHAEEKAIGSFNLFADLKSQNSANSSGLSHAEKELKSDRTFEAAGAAEQYGQTVPDIPACKPQDIDCEYACRVSFEPLRVRIEDGSLKALTRGEQMSLKGKDGYIFVYSMQGKEIGKIFNFNANNGLLYSLIGKKEKIYVIYVCDKYLDIWIDRESKALPKDKFHSFFLSRNDDADNEPTSKKTRTNELSERSADETEGKSAKVICEELLADGVLKFNEDDELADQIAELNNLLNNSQEILSRTMVVHRLTNTLKKVRGDKAYEFFLKSNRQKAFFAKKLAVKKAAKGSAAKKSLSKNNAKKRTAQGKDACDVPKIYNSSSYEYNPHTEPLSNNDLFVHQINVVGTSYADKKAVQKVKENAVFKLSLEEDNPADRFAVKFSDIDGSKLGYIPKEQNHLYYLLLKAGVRLYGKAAFKSDGKFYAEVWQETD